MSHTKTLFRQLKSMWFPGADDSAWREWVDTRPSDSMRELVTLIQSDVRLVFKARALFLLLAYRDAYNPIYWKGGHIGGPWSELDYIKNLDEDLLKLAAKLVVAFHEDAKSRSRDGWIVNYERQMLALLARLPEAEAEELFDHYPLNDLVPFWNLDDSSGYNPFNNLLHDKSIAESWKRRADAQVREIIELEEANKRHPRQDYERALMCYASILSLVSYSKVLPYSVEFFTEQVEFAARKCATSQQNPYVYSSLLKFFDILQGDPALSARHQLARLVVLTTDCGHPYVIRSNERLHEAEIMHADAISTGDDELKTALDAILETGRQYLAQAEANQAEEQRTRQAACDGLR